jgi:hypothetical protein
MQYQYQHRHLPAKPRICVLLLRHGITSSVDCAKAYHSTARAQGGLRQQQGRVVRDWRGSADMPFAPPAVPCRAVLCCSSLACSRRQGHRWPQPAAPCGSCWRQPSWRRCSPPRACEWRPTLFREWLPMALPHATPPNPGVRTCAGAPVCACCSCTRFCCCWPAST